MVGPEQQVQKNKNVLETLKEKTKSSSTATATTMAGIASATTIPETTQQTSTMSEKNKNNKKKHNNNNNNNNKRKRLDPEEQLEQERMERYEKLVHQAKKAIHKEAKIVKSFECQKIVRKIKELYNDAQVKKDASTTTTTTTSITKQPTQKQQKQQRQDEFFQNQLTAWKSFSLDAVVHVCLQRLGILNLDPKLSNTHYNNQNDEGKEEESSRKEVSLKDMEFVEQIVQHKRFIANGGILEVWNDKVTEYRRWYLKRRDVVMGVPDFVQQQQQQQQQNNPSQNERKKKKKQTSQTVSNQSNKVDDSMVNNLFVSLGGVVVDEDDEEYPDRNETVEEGDYHYGPATGLAMITTRNKNRPGQRQRKAKALAVEAKKKGRTWNKSFNIREKKEPINEEDAKQLETTNIRPKQVEASKIAEMGKTWKEEGHAHPSWAARTSVKTGIVEFTGKKITFD